MSIRSKSRTVLALCGNAALVSCLLGFTATNATAAEQSPPTNTSSNAGTTAHATNVGLFGSVGYLGSPGSSGAVADVGVRVGVARHVALSLDYGYGMLGATGHVQDPTHRVEDRWWLMPSVALVIPTNRMRFDLGIGAGLATGSGYTSWSSFGAGPFKPEWAFQLAPAVRVHGIAALAVARDVDIFARLDVGSLVLDGSSIGIRNGNARPDLMDTTWLGLSFGVQSRVF